MMTRRAYEFAVWVNGGANEVGIRSPSVLPACSPRHDSYFMNCELRAIMEIGEHGHPWWFQNFYMIRLWWYRAEYHALAVQAFRAGKLKRNAGNRREQ